MAKGLYKYIVGIMAEDMAYCSSMKLLDVVSLTAEEHAEIDPKQKKGECVTHHDHIQYSVINAHAKSHTHMPLIYYI